MVQTIFARVGKFIGASLVWVVIAAVLGFILGYWISSSTGHWMLLNSTSGGSMQTVGIFQTKRRCSRFMESHKERIKNHRSEEQAKMMSGEEKEIVSSLEQEGIIIYQLSGELSWVTVSCVRLNDGFLTTLLSATQSTLSDIESTVNDLKSRIEDIESR